VISVKKELFYYSYLTIILIIKITIMGLNDLVGKFFDGVKKNTANRYLEEARKKREKEESSPEYKEKLKKEKISNAFNEKFYKKMDIFQDEQNELVEECKWLSGDELEKQIIKTVKHYQNFSKKMKRYYKSDENRLIKKCRTSPRISKDDAIKKMKELKEFLDLTVISQEEFDEKSEPLKKIILGK